MRNDVLDFSEITLTDLGRVGGKNASLGELFRALKPKGVGVVDGFATTADAYRRLLATQASGTAARDLHRSRSRESRRAGATGHAARTAVLETPLPDDLKAALVAALRATVPRLGREPELAVRSSATAEDLPGGLVRRRRRDVPERPRARRPAARGPRVLVRRSSPTGPSAIAPGSATTSSRWRCRSASCRWCGRTWRARASSSRSTPNRAFATPWSSRAPTASASSSSRASSRRTSGRCSSRRWPTGHRPSSAAGSAARKCAWSTPTAAVRRAARRRRRPSATRFCLTDDEVLTLARWACLIEAHYSARAGHAQPMDIEWAKDGATGELFIVQARPETVHSREDRARRRRDVSPDAAAASRRS